MNMRAKMKVVSAKKHSENYEDLEFSAVCKSDGYPADGSDENNTFAKFTPTATMKMSITNPALVGKFVAGQEFYIDFTPTSLASSRPPNPPGAKLRGPWEPHEPGRQVA